MNQSQSIPELQHAPGRPAENLGREELRDVIDLALWAGQLLLQYGAESALVEETVHRLGTGLGCSWLDIFISHSAIILTTNSGDEFRTKTRRVVRFGGVNMSIVAAINDLSRQVTAGELNRFAVRERLEQIDHLPHHYNRWFTAVMIGLACGAFSKLFGADWPTFGLTMAASTVAIVVRQELTKRFFNQFLIVTLTAFVAGLISSLGIHQHIGGQPAIALAASVLLLVPGVPLINAIEDLLKAHMVTGVSRGVTGALVSLSIAGGLALAMTLSGLGSIWPTFAVPATAGEDALWAGLAALGFAILFNVQPRLLVWCVLCGASGHVVRFWLMHFGPAALHPIELATFLGASTIGFAAVYLARWQKVPAVIFAVSGVIPMVPGTFAFRTMLGVLQLAGMLQPPAGTDLSQLLTDTSISGIKTGLILAALALGISMPSLIFRRHRPVV